jgi:hypothetical protein
MKNLLKSLFLHTVSDLYSRCADFTHLLHTQKKPSGRQTPFRRLLHSPGNHKNQKNGRTCACPEQNIPEKQ